MHDPTNNKYRCFSFKGSGIYRRFISEGKTILAVNSPNYQQASLPHGTYGALLLTSEWRSKRDEILIRDNKNCVVCKSSKSLQVHHRQYHFVVNQNQFKMPWDYPENLLITLCEPCHKRGHNKFKVPTINI